MLFGFRVDNELLILHMENGVRARTLDVGRSSTGRPILLIKQLYFDSLG